MRKLAQTFLHLANKQRSYGHLSVVNFVFCEKASVAKTAKSVNSWRIHGIGTAFALGFSTKFLCKDAK